MCAVGCGARGVGAARRAAAGEREGFGAGRQWERGWERVRSVCLFVTFSSHGSKCIPVYAFIVVRCQRLEGVGFLLTALLRFCETVNGPFGRQTRDSPTRRECGWFQQWTNIPHCPEPEVPKT
jgi:hypothetical protein